MAEILVAACSLLLAAPAALAEPLPPPLTPSSGEETAEPLPELPPSPPAADATAPENALPLEERPPLELELSANRQSYDSQRNRFVASGNVMATLARGRLMADRIEFDTRSRTIYAYGSVRFQRGQQYLQASQLRYSLLEGTGEMQDVYGVLDLDSTDQDLDPETTPSVPMPPPEPISCPAAIPSPPEWHPHPWALTVWGGQMFHSDFGDTFLFQGVRRPEYVAGLGVQRRLFQAGPFALELDLNWLHHWAAAQSGGRYTDPLSTEEVAGLSTRAQNFSEFTAGLMLRAWLRPWLSIGFEEGFSATTSLSNYECTYRRECARFLNYLAFEVEAMVTPEWSAVGRIHHRSGAFGTYNDVTEGSNAYLLGLRWRSGNESTTLETPNLPAPQGCPDAPDPAAAPPEGLAEQLEQTAMGPEAAAAPPRRAGEAPARPAAAQGTVWQRARAQEKARREAIARVDQRIEDLSFQQSLTAERRFGFPSSLDVDPAANQFGEIRPQQLRDLTTRDNRELVKGTISRWRFQARRLQFSPGRLSGDRVGFTNDPFTPAQSWLDSEDVVMTLLPDGTTEVRAGRNELRLEDRLPIPVTRRQRFAKEEEVTNRWALGYDRDDRDGFFVGYNVPIRIGEEGSLNLQPQFLLERAYRDETESYPLPGEPAGSSTQPQPVEASDLFGLQARLDMPVGDFRLNGNLELSTFNSENIADGTRTWGELARIVDLPLIGDSLLRFYGAYRFRVWNGSLGEQDIYTAYGVSLEDSGELPDWGRLRSNYFWRAGVGYYRASPFQEAGLLNLWRSNAFGSVNMTLPLWRGKPAAPTVTEAYASTGRPIVPGLRLRANVQGSLAYFGDGTNQNTISLSGGPTLTLGHFVRPYLDYTELTVTGGGTLRQGLSPLGFDRAVDLGTLGVGLTQQIVGPLVFNGGIGFNVDPGSEFYGETTSSYVELRWQRRAYEIGVFYSPYEGLGGVRVKLNDFNFKGTGVPFIPYDPLRTPAEQRPF